MYTDIGDESDEGYTLLAKVDNVKNVSLVLKAISFKDTGVCFATEYGMKVVVEDSKCVQANAFIGNDIFQEYVVKDEPVMFRVDLSTLVECLTIFDGYTSLSGATTSLKMTYKEHGQPLKILLEEEGVITDCTLKTLNDCETLDYEIAASSVVCKVILKATDIKEVFLDLDATSDWVEFLFSADPPNFRILTRGIAGECQIDIPKSSDIVETFECSDTLCFRYKYSQLKPSFKSLSISSKVSIRSNEEGLICLQFMIQTESKQSCYVEYYCSPVIDN